MKYIKMELPGLILMVTEKQANYRVKESYQESKFPIANPREMVLMIRTNKDGKYIKGNTIKVDMASDIAIVFFEFF